MNAAKNEIKISKVKDVAGTSNRKVPGDDKFQTRVQNELTQTVEEQTLKQAQKNAVDLEKEPEIWGRTVRGTEKLSRLRKRYVT